MKKKPNLPSDRGSFAVLKYDKDDELISATPIIFPQRGQAQQFADQVDPRTDPFVAEEKEHKNGDQKGKDPKR